MLPSKNILLPGLLPSSYTVVAWALAERQPDREAKIAGIGGWVYLGIKALG